MGALVSLLGAGSTAALIVATATLLGLWLVPRRWRARQPGLRLVQALSLGLTSVSLAVWLAGQALGTWAVGPLFGALCLMATGRAGLGWRLLVNCSSRAVRAVRSAPWAAGLAVLPLLVIAPSVVLPVLDSDGLRYHLALPKLFLLEGRVFWYPWDVTGAYPQGAEMLNLIGLGAGFPETAKILHFGVFLLNCGLLVAALRRPGRSSWPGFCAAALYGASPVVLAGAGAAFIDQYVVFHCAVAMLLALRRGRPGAVGLTLAGAGWVKWAAGPAVLGIVAVAAMERRSLRYALASALPVAAVLIPVAVRNTLVTGDPVYPMATGLVTSGVPSVDESLLERVVTQRHAHIPGPLGLPWGTVLGEVPADEVVGWVHLLGLIVAPLGMASRRGRLAAALVAPYLLVGLAYHPSVRLCMPLMWGLAVLEGQVLGRIGWRWLGATVVGLGLLQTPQASSLGYDLAVDYLTGRTSLDEVRRTRVVGWDAAQAVNRYPGDGRVMALDFPPPFFFDRPWVAEGLVNVPPARNWLDEATSYDEFRAFLEAENITMIVATPGYAGGHPLVLEPLARSWEQVLWVRRLVEESTVIFADKGITVLALR